MEFFQFLLTTATIILPLFAYFSTKRKPFLILNSIAIFLFGVNFYIHEGYIGVFSEILMLLTHMLALFSNDKILYKLKYILPIVTFALLSYLYRIDISYSLFDIFMPLAITMFSFGALEKNMLHNKILFSFGLVFLFIYSFSIGAIDVMVSSLFGILLNLYAFNELLAKKNNKEA